MGNKEYCVFWYPTIYHISLKYKATNKRPIIKGEDISDKADGVFKRFLDITLDNEDLIIETYSLAVDKESHIDSIQFKLTQEKSSNNGFVLYSYDISDYKASKEARDIAFCKKFNRLLQNVFYHHAKSFYHDHEINHSADSGLSAYLCTDECDIFSINNPPLMDFLTQFNESFIRYAEDVSIENQEFDRLKRNIDSFNKITKAVYKKAKKEKPIEFAKTCEQMRQLENAHSEIQSSKKNAQRNNGYTSFWRLKKSIKKINNEQYLTFRKKLNIINEICGNALIEYTYCKTLLESKYNLLFRHDIIFSEEEIKSLGKVKTLSSCPEELQILQQKDQYRQSALNIRNSIRYIECIKFKCLNKANNEIDFFMKNTDKVGKRSWYIAIISLIVAILGLIIAFT